MPIQVPQWTDYLNCPVCCREFGAPPRSPVSLGCGHTLCRHCLIHLHRKQCPFDHTVIQVEPEELVVNTALLLLAGYTPPSRPYHPPSIQALSEADRHAYDVIIWCMENLAAYLKFCGNANNSMGGSRLSRPMQRKLVTLLQCAMTDEEGRGRAARAARSLGERTVTELILQHQNPQQLSANLWAAVRARGCQFLGPAMQEEVLKLVLLTLEDGSSLSRKVLVMFVVQALEPHFPQASKTSIGHVVQLLYRASCFKVSKRESDSSLMQLKEEFRTYECLRREHDAQIVQIATEAGLRIAPDQWSALLYGDTTHKSHMQSIIDKLQTPQSFSQSVSELYIVLQRTGDPAQHACMHLERLSNIDASPDATSPSWQQLADLMTSLQEVVSGLFHYLQQQVTGRDPNHNQNLAIQDRSSEPSTSQPSPQTAASTPTHSRYKVSMCRDAATLPFCPRGIACTFAHSEEELERYRAVPSTSPVVTNGNYTYIPPLPPAMPMPLPQGMPLPPQAMYTRFPMQPHHVDNFNLQFVSGMTPQPMPPEMIQCSDYPMDNLHNVDGLSVDYPPAIHNQPPMTISTNGIIIPMSERPYYGRFSGILPIHKEPSNNLQYPPPEYPGPVYQGPSNAGPMPVYQGQDSLAPPLPNMYINIPNEPQRNVSPYPFEDLAMNYRVKPPPIVPVPIECRPEPMWPPANDVFAFDAMRNTLQQCTNSSENLFNVPGDQRVVGVDRIAAVADRLTAVDMSNRADDDELEEELQALERRIDTEYMVT